MAVNSATIEKKVAADTGAEKRSDRELYELLLNHELFAETMTHLGSRWLRGRLPIEAVREFDRPSAAKLLALRELRVRWLRAAIDMRRPLRQLSRLTRYLDARHALLDQEVGGIVLLDDEGAMVGEELLFQGHLGGIRTCSRVIIGSVLRRRQHRFLIFHTHPSTPLPSSNDYEFHERLLARCQRVDVELADNLTIAPGGGYCSLYETELIRWPRSVRPPIGPITTPSTPWWGEPVN